MTVRFIKSPEGDDLAVLPREEFEDLVDGRIAARALEALSNGDDELLTSEETRELLSAESPLAFWMNKREVSPSDLATKLGIGLSDLMELESGRRDGPLSVYRRAADILGVRLSDLLD